MNRSVLALQSCDLFKNQLISRISTVFSKYKQSDIVIWGTGEFGQGIARFLVNHLNLKQNIKCFCDSFHDDSVYKEIESIPVFSPIKSVAEYPQAVYLIASDFSKEILSSIAKSDYRFIKTSVADADNFWLVRQMIPLFSTNVSYINSLMAFNYTWFDMYAGMKQSGKLDKYIEAVYSMLEDDVSKLILENRFKTLLSGDLSFIEKNPIDETIYFSTDCYKLGKEEVLFDCGAFDGDTIKGFYNFTKGNYKKVLAFEPDKKNFNKLNTLIEENSYHDVDALEAATGSTDGEVCFTITGNMGARVVQGNPTSSVADNSVKLVKLDNYIDYKPTLIKMDIEGAELDTLKGASEIIQVLKPKFALSIYHKPLDFYEIPMFLKSLVPEYKFKVRQHQLGFYDTVLYAYVE